MAQSFLEESHYRSIVETQLASFMFMKDFRFPIGINLLVTGHEKFCKQRVKSLTITFKYKTYNEVRTYFEIVLKHSNRI